MDSNSLNPKVNLRNLKFCSMLTETLKKTIIRVRKCLLKEACYYESVQM